MNATQPGRISFVDADLALPVGRVQLVRNFWEAPIDSRGTAHRHHLELSMLPRSGEPRGCFPDHWGPRRFEPMGPVFLLPAEQTFHALSQCRQQSSVICDLDPHAIDQWFEGELRWTDRRLRAGLDIVSHRIRGLLVAMADELRSPGFASRTLVELMAAQAAIELSRHLMGIEERRPAGGLSARQLRLIDERVANPEAPPSLSELAGLCGISVRHLTRAFRISRGRSIGHYLEESRVERSKRLLRSGHSVKAVASSVGFTAASNFAAAFRRATGESPREFQQRHAAGRNS